MATKAEVSIDVKNIIAALAGASDGNLLDTLILQSPPLSFDSAGLNFLALSLRGYIKSRRAQATILAPELKTDQLSVGGVVTLVFNKI